MLPPKVLRWYSVPEPELRGFGRGDDLEVCLHGQTKALFELASTPDWKKIPSMCIIADEESDELEAPFKYQANGPSARPDGVIRVSRNKKSGDWSTSRTHYETHHYNYSI